jgi:hypothetical protein
VAGFVAADFTGAGFAGALATTLLPWRVGAAFEAARVAAGAVAVRAEVDLPAWDEAALFGVLDRADFALVFALVLGIGIVRSEKPGSLIECGAGACEKNPAVCNYRPVGAPAR